MHLVSTADSIEVNDSDNIVFLDTEWIGKNKTFPPRASIPEFILTAYTTAFSVPSSLKNYLPHSKTTVLEFIEFKLPSQTATPSFINPDTWFSQDSPSSDLALLLSRPIPHAYLLDNLKKLSGQAWFDARLSITDCRFHSNTTEHFPLSALTLWYELQTASSAQRHWAQSLNWLSTQLKRPELTAQDRLVFEESRDRLSYLPYDGDVETKGIRCRTLEFTRFFGQLGEAAWLSRDLLDLAVEHLNRRLDVTGDTCVFIGNLLMMQEIRRAVKGQGMSKRVYRIGKQASNGDITKVYLITLINRHWVTICADISSGLVTYGDSLRHPQQYEPHDDMLSIKKWLSSFGIHMQVEGASLPHGVQPDVSSCGVFALNMISHAVFKDVLLKSVDVGIARAEWFNTLTNNYLLSRNDSIATTSRNEHLDHTAEQSSRMNLDFLCRRDESVVSGLGCEDLETLEPGTMIESLSVLPDVTPSSSANLDQDEDYPMDETPSKHDAQGEPADDLMDLDQTIQNGTEVPTNSPVLFPLFAKGYRPTIGNSTAPKKSAMTRTLPESETSQLVVGTSNSAQKDRRARAAHEAGTFEIKPARERSWRRGISEIDGRAQFRDNNVMEVLCSKCRKWYKVGAVYNKYRYKEHFNKCKGKLGNQRTMDELKDSFGVAFKTHRDELVEKKVDVSKVACPGLSKDDDERIGHYLRRTMAPGGGGRALHKLALEKYDMKYSELDAEEQEVIDNMQVDGHLWRNDFRRGRVYALKCLREIIVSASKPTPSACRQCQLVLVHGGFVRLLQKDATEDKNLIFVNHRYRDPVMGEKYANTLGLREILTSSSESNLSMFLRYAIGVDNGTYADNKILSGLVEACMMVEDKKKRGVGMQGFRWGNAKLADYDRMLHVLYIESPAAYRHFAKYLPARTERSFQIMEGKAPKMPMAIRDRSFELVSQQLEVLCYEGPISLSWDDTKLLPAFRLFWDPDRKAHFLVGAIEGPICVADPEMARAIADDLSHVLGTKVRLFCLQIPLAGVAPIMVAAIPISDNLDILELTPLSTKILYGLLDHGIHVVSCCCDGTETERGVQRLIAQNADSQLIYKIPSPADPKYELEIIVAVIRGHPIIMIQDSLHARKTYRNNLFSGARLLAFGNYVALYRHIREIAFEEGSPLYHRDIEKLDRQDDNAAARLFSAATLQFIVARHPGYLGDIVFLFVFGELPDAYQNRTISHLERMKIILRAHYFVQMWQAFLRKAGYPESRYCLSREAIDITHFLTNGLFALVAIHRDHYTGDHPFPLLPWFHGTEACEHSFGCSRSIITDFTLLDFYFMIQKTRTKMHEGFLLAKSSADPKARATGYNHTYMDSHGMDLQVLAVYPTDKEIADVACVAFEEAEALVALLGVVPPQLHREDPTLISLPGFDSLLHNDLFTDNETEEYSHEDDQDCAAKLRQLLREDHWHTGLSAKEDEKLTNLSLAAMSLSIDDMLTVASLPDDDVDTEKDICTQERSRIRAQTEFILPDVDVLEGEKPFGKGTFSMERLDLGFLVAERMKHQTRQAEHGVRTQTGMTTVSSEGSEGSKEPTSTHSARRAILKGIQEVLREQQDRGNSTGRNREARWHEGGTEASKATGNSANAAVVSATAARDALKKREKLFHLAQVPLLALIKNAQISTVRSIKIAQYGIIYGEDTFGVAIGRVEALYVKSGGKNAKHGSVDESHSVGALSHVAVQVYEYTYARKFRAIPHATSALQTSQYWLLPPLSFLCLLMNPPQQTLHGLTVSEKDEGIFKEFLNATKKIKAAMVLSRKRGKNAVRIDDS
ncbi:hypothetical protein PHLCEN_2v9692 [Hermanssonia centrifuga]|uniref:Ubiquitin-like protease family profile domain-containing protein n=1 Tax=Hermanssonia centrifuga TaxID=98765 RepID=A0A2R6NQ28_9APHY|nr:hypothetical protein PHLCEN_2v9692 [Hermanssonia centrifuga]